MATKNIFRYDIPCCSSQIVDFKKSGEIVCVWSHSLRKNTEFIFISVFFFQSSYIISSYAVKMNIFFLQTKLFFCLPTINNCITYYKIFTFSVPKCLYEIYLFYRRSRIFWSYFQSSFSKSYCLKRDWYLDSGFTWKGFTNKYKQRK